MHPWSVPKMTGESQPSMAGSAWSVHCTQYGSDLRQGEREEKERKAELLGEAQATSPQTTAMTCIPHLVWRKSYLPLLSLESGGRQMGRTHKADCFSRTINRGLSRGASFKDGQATIPPKALFLLTGAGSANGGGGLQG